MKDKVDYFLKTFPNREWSGPAWYSFKKNKMGYPTKVTLEYWHPLDLGTKTATEWDAEDLMEIYSDLRKEFPKIGKEWVQGNIHSHNDMGAYFSGTDDVQNEEGANENFFVSLVVSTKKNHELHAGICYPDQFGNIIVDIIENFDTPGRKPKPEWKEQAKSIKAVDIDNMPSYWNLHKSGKMKNKRQANLFITKNEETLAEIEELREWNRSFAVDDYDIDWDKWDTATLDYERGRIKKKEYQAILKKIGADEYGQILAK